MRVRVCEEGGVVFFLLPLLFSHFTVCRNSFSSCAPAVVDGRQRGDERRPTNISEKWGRRKGTDKEHKGRLCTVRKKRICGRHLHTAHTAHVWPSGRRPNRQDRREAASEKGGGESVLFRKKKYLYTWRATRAGERRQT
ncbi:hypothetical protein TRSC58_07620 [Trypanosoma rangeli SC58]|uniref:Secreted protein n=1 Tax=Trypanosoma rangeli SC58 TaxID=429131 RepID=A0A061IST8_TRYRA|nr:hypothetical protein TRSC58_07620 [Trypanosoma rangeli SC58]